MKRNSAVKFAWSLVAFAGLLSSGVVNAQSCSTYASNIVNKFSTFPPNSTMQARLATNNSSNSPYVSYGAATTLVYVPGHRIGGLYMPPSLQSTGAMQQFFSDRTWSPSVPPGEFAPSYPFNPAATDNLGVTVWLGTGGAYSTTSGYSIHPGDVTFILDSWGDAVVSFVPERCDGMIYGLSGNTAILLSLFDMSAPVIIQ